MVTRSALALLIAGACAAHAACAPDGAVPASVAGVAEDLDVTLADGRVVRLAGIDPPLATVASPDLPARARAAVVRWVEAGARVAPLAPAPDRWGRVPALLFRAGDSGEAGTMLAAQGLARVRPETAAHACLADRLAAEGDARAAKRGLWADPAYAVLRADDRDGLAAQAGGMALVEGLLRVEEAGGGLRLRLGPARRGFEAYMSRRDLKDFARAGLDPRDYAGTPVRLRGDLDARFGPSLHLAGPDGFESLEPGSLADPPAPRGGPPEHWTPAPRESIQAPSGPE